MKIAKSVRRTLLATSVSSLVAAVGVAEVPVCELDAGPVLFGVGGASHNWFGNSVATDGASVVVGAMLDTGTAADSGSAYVFVRLHSGWALQTRLTVPDAAIFDRAGHSVAILRDTAVLGAPYATTEFGETGAIFVFYRSSAGWSFAERLLPADVASLDRFGYSLAIEEGAIYAGSLFGRTGSIRSGCVHLFSRQRSSWIAKDVIRPVDPEASSRFGYSIALDADRLNCDGFVTVADIGGFVLALTDPAAYAAQYPGCDINLADTNNDGLVTVGDIGAFVALLTG